MLLRGCILAFEDAGKEGHFAEATLSVIVYVGIEWH